MKTILFIGCSNGLGMHHALRQVFQKKQSESIQIYPNKNKNGKFPDEILSDEYYTYINLSCPGAGNRYIRSRLFEAVSKHEIDYVYLQFSGLYRNDLILDIEHIDLIYQDWLKKTVCFKVTDTKVYCCAGNFLVSDANNISAIDKVNLMSCSLKNYNYNNDNSLQEIFSSISFLDKIGIQYNWTTYYDYMGPPESKIKKTEGSILEWPRWINCQKKISGSPYDYCIKNGMDPADGVHYGYDWFLKFIENHKKEFNFPEDHK